MNIYIWQAIYLTGGAILLPFAPFLYLQGRFVRRKIGILPDARGAKIGESGAGSETANLLVIGESTVAGLGASTHAKGLAGQFAESLSRKIGKKNPLAGNRQKRCHGAPRDQRTRAANPGRKIRFRDGWSRR